MERDEARGLRTLRIKPPQYSGKKTENIKQYYSKLEKYLDAYGVEDAEQRIEATGLCFEGDALEHFDYLRGANEEATYDVIKEAMISRFYDDKIPIVIRSRISKRKLKPNETVSEYYNEQRREANKIDMSDDAFLFAFVQGLPHEYMKQILVQNPETPNEALMIAKTIEQVEGLNKCDDVKSGLELLKSDLKNAKICAAQEDCSHAQNKEIVSMLKDISKSLQALTKSYQSRTNGPSTPSDQPNNPRHSYNQSRYFTDPKQAPRQPSYNNGGQNGARFRFNNNGGGGQARPSQSNGNFRNFSSNGGPKQGHQWSLGNRQTKPTNDQNRMRFNQNRKEPLTGEVPFNKDFTLMGSINGRRVSVLLDTGSSISIISEKTLKTLGVGIEIEAAEFENVIGVNASKSKVKGMIRCKINLGGHLAPVRLNVISDTHHQVLLGRDFIADHVKEMDTVRNTFAIRLHHTPMSTLSASAADATGVRHAVRARVSRRMDIRPNEEADIEIYPDGDMVAKQLVFLAGDSMRWLGLSAQNQLVPGGVGVMNVKVRNTSGKPVKLFANKIIGLLQVPRSAQTCGILESTKYNSIEENVQEHADHEAKFEKLKTFLHERRTPGDSSHYCPPIIPPMLSRDESEILSNMARRVPSYRKQAKEIKEAEKMKMKQSNDRRWKARLTTFDVGDKVLVKDMGLRQKPNSKWRPKFPGPFKLIEKVTPVSYRIDTQNNMQINDWVHIDRMKRWVDRVDTHNHATPSIPLHS